jgi:hypothetical protein
MEILFWKRHSLKGQSMKIPIKKTRLAWCFVALTGLAFGDIPPKVQWGRQILTPTADSIFGSMVADSHNDIYMAVNRESESASGAKSSEHFLLKYSQAGDLMWEKQLGASGEKPLLHMAADDLAADDQGNIYVFGHTKSSLSQENLGKSIRNPSAGPCCLHGGR